MQVGSELGVQGGLIRPVGLRDGRPEGLGSSLVGLCERCLLGQSARVRLYLGVALLDDHLRLRVGVVEEDRLRVLRLDGAVVGLEHPDDLLDNRHLR